MAASTQISVEEYLRTTYRPDCDYVDGEVRERNVGERDHSEPQAVVAAYFYNRKAQWRICALTEQRVQVIDRRFRIPDICVLRADAPREQIVTAPPLISIEILSKDDTFKSVNDRLEDSASMGVPNVWMLDPRRRRGYVYNSQGFLEAKDGVLRVAGSEIAVPLAEIFES